MDQKPTIPVFFHRLDSVLSILDTSTKQYVVSITPIIQAQFPLSEVPAIHRCFYLWLVVEIGSISVYYNTVKMDT
jgi:uncharacterized membrane protein